MTSSRGVEGPRAQTRMRDETHGADRYAAVKFIATSQKPTIVDSRDLSSARWRVFAPFVAEFSLHDVYKRARHAVTTM